MQEIKKRRIVLASVLKPVDDPRMFEKMGQSLAEKYEVHIIGQDSQLKETYPSIYFHTLTPFGRLNFSRLLAPVKILRQIFSLKPELLIICTHELLFIALVAKIFRGTRIIYDVQENYWRNIIYGKTLPFLVMPIIAGYVRITEWIVSPFLDYYFLAEAGYEKEMKFIGNKKVVLENKLKRQASIIGSRESKPDGNIRLLFSGTLAETTGVFTAIALATALHKVDDSIRLLIIGHCSIPLTLKQIKRGIEDKPFIQLMGGDTLVPHQHILSAIQDSDFGIIAYPQNPSTENSIPTKLYEYLGYQLPILLVDHKPWLAICEPCQAAVAFQPADLDPVRIKSEMLGKTFYSTTPEGVFWESEGSKLLKTVGNLLS